MSTIQVADKPTLDRVDANTRGLSGLAGIDDLIIACFDAYKIDKGSILTKGNRLINNSYVWNVLNVLRALDNKTFHVSTNIRADTLSSSGINIQITSGSLPNDYSNLEYLYFIHSNMNNPSGTQFSYISKLTSYTETSPILKYIPSPPNRYISSLANVWDELKTMTNLPYTDVTITPSETTVNIKATIPDASSSYSPLIGLVWRLKD